MGVFEFKFSVFGTRKRWNNGKYGQCF